MTITSLPIPKGYYHVSPDNNLVICEERQKEICENFMKTFPNYWREALLKADIKARNYNRLCLITFYSQSSYAGIAKSIKCSSYLFVPTMKVIISEHVCPSIMSNDMICDNLSVVAID